MEIQAAAVWYFWFWWSFAIVCFPHHASFVTAIDSGIEKLFFSLDFVNFFNFGKLSFPILDYKSALLPFIVEFKSFEILLADNFFSNKVPSSCIPHLDSIRDGIKCTNICNIFWWALVSTQLNIHREIILYFQLVLRVWEWMPVNRLSNEPFVKVESTLYFLLIRP